MTYSYTQISQYLICPRRYRHRYLDGWKEKDTRGAMLFGRAFEQALGAYFRRQDPGDVLFREWSVCKDQDLRFSSHDTWDHMLEQGIMLLTASARMTASKFPSRHATCKSNSHGRSEVMNSSPTLTQLDSSTGHAACWSGRPPRADIRKNLRASWLLTHSWSAIPG
jgi:PD-(D/E)XK nuclease superfamily